ncbi:DUF1643 domain-containing protein [Oceanobacillus halotolerans]|uniref:DUF1643 domain-containing protein n=1 Tax=Oceanobacillus halotolerans TaxID=2663380 RepID=UPI0013DD652F|nr:DUF1643 domain-containing protein [Oceanobacillus halotolerans]
MAERKAVYFSKYIQEDGIVTVPYNINEEGLYRYSMTIPFKGRDNSKKAIVIMKNPSKAGKFDSQAQRKISDETIYRVTDYLYKHEQNYSEVIILNLFAIYSSIFDEGVEEELIYGNDNMEKNNRIILSTLEDLEDGDRVIVGWGRYPKRTGFRDNYRERIEEVLTLLNGVTLWRVGNFVKVDSWHFPQHGLNWYDYEVMKEFWN